MTKTLHERINEAFSSGAVQKAGESLEAFLARNSAAARKVIELTRELDLVRQPMTEAPEWTPPAGIPLNAFALRYVAGRMGKGLSGYPFDPFGRARVAKLEESKRRARERQKARNRAQ